MRKLKNKELGRITEEEFREAAKTPVVIVLDNVRSLLNVGSIFRTADAFRLELLCLCGITGFPPNREIEKTALGATKTVDWKYYKNASDALSELKSDGYRIFAVEQAEKSTKLNVFIPAGKTAVVFGHEVNGVSKEVMELCDGCLEVPQIGTKHSLNVAVCAGIVAWELYVKLDVKTELNSLPSGKR